MRQFQTTLEVRTPGRGLHPISSEIEQAVRESNIRTGLCVVFCCHTSASLLVQEGADPTAKQDLLDWLGRIAPDGDPQYSHDLEGPDDMPSHLRSAVTRTSETIPIVSGKLALGTWQELYLAEHRKRGHTRRIVVHIVGD